MASDEDDFGGWGPKAWDLLLDRVNAIRADLNALMGRPPSANPPQSGEPRIAGIGLTTWIAIFATIVVPLIGTAVLVILHNP